MASGEAPWFPPHEVLFSPLWIFLFNICFHRLVVLWTEPPWLALNFLNLLCFSSIWEISSPYFLNVLLLPLLPSETTISLPAAM